MKKLIIILVLTAFCSISYGQSIISSGAPKTTQHNLGGAWIDSVLRLPQSFANYNWLDSTGRMWFQGGKIYYHDGTTRIPLGTGTGTVSSVGSGYGLLGGPITSAGTLLVDTSKLVTYYQLHLAQIDTTSLSNRINSKEDTSGVAGNINSIPVFTGRNSIGSSSFFDSIFVKRAYVFDTLTLNSYVYLKNTPPATLSDSILVKGSTKGTIRVVGPPTAIYPVSVSWPNNIFSVDTSTSNRLVSASYLRLRGYGSGTVTSITPGYGFTSSTPITTSGSLVIDSSKLLTVYAFGVDTTNKWIPVGSISGNQYAIPYFNSYNNISSSNILDSVNIHKAYINDTLTISSYVYLKNTPSAVSSDSILVRGPTKGTVRVAAPPTAIYPASVTWPGNVYSVDTTSTNRLVSASYLRSQAYGIVNSVSGTSNRITSTGGANPAIDISASYIGQGSITTLGTVTTATWNAATVQPLFGGTGLNSYQTGDIIYASATNILSKRAIGNPGDVYTVSGGIGVWSPPAVSSITLTGDVTGSGTSTIATTLASAGTPGTYGSATQVPVFTTDLKGRVISVTNTLIASQDTAKKDWHTYGNRDGKIDTIGTLDKNNVNFITNSVLRAILDTSGNFKVNGVDTAQGLNISGGSSGGGGTGHITIGNNLSGTPQTMKIFLGVGDVTDVGANVGYMGWSSTSSIFTASASSIGLINSTFGFRNISAINSNVGVTYNGPNTNPANSFTWSIGSSGSAYAPTSGTYTGSVFNMTGGGSWNPASGTATYAHVTLNNTVNETGTASGIIRSLYVNPTLTAVTGSFRGIETNVSIGYSTFNNGAAPNYSAGKILAGNSTDNGVGEIQVTGSITATSAPTSATTTDKIMVYHSATGEYEQASFGPYFTQNTATDANYVITTTQSTNKLPVITANRTVTLPTNVAGAIVKIWNQNTSGTFSWSFSGTVKDASGTTITTLINSAWYILEADGTNWNKQN